MYRGTNVQGMEGWKDGGVDGERSGRFKDGWMARETHIDVDEGMNRWPDGLKMSSFSEVWRV